MSLVQKVLTAIGGIANYGVISILLFFTVFMGSLIWVCLQNKNFMATMSTMPLENCETNPTVKGNKDDEQ